MVGRYLTADRPGDSSVEDKEAIFNTTTHADRFTGDAIPRAQETRASLD